MPTKISKIARELNVGVSTAAEFLRKKGVTVDDNPNARIADDAVDMLYKEYAGDKQARARVDAASAQRDDMREARKAEKAAAKAEKVAAKAQSEKKEKPALKVLGKVELDRIGNVVKPAPAPAPKPEAESRPAPEAPKAEAAPAPAGEVKPAPAPAAPEAAPVKAEVTVAPAETPRPEAPEAPKAAQEQPESQVTPMQGDVKILTPESKANPEVFRPASSVQTPQFKVVGTIDLSAINSSTRPRKHGGKGRGGAGTHAQGQAQGASGSSRRKRNRIGKEKVDVEKTASQPGFDSSRPKKQNGQGGAAAGDRSRQGQNQNAQGGGHGKRSRGQKTAPKPVQLSDEEVQKQVKETLARLTNKQTKKSVKYRREKREEAHNRMEREAQREAAESKVIKITEFVTVNDLANLMEVPVTKIIGTCMSLGLMVSINQRLDAETINIVAEEFGFTTEYVSAEVSEAITVEEDKEEDLLPRPPIVTVMGHVDHGKTSLLDYIRKANVIAGEAGGITQHIGAYNVKLADGRHITFLDTPGHEAFTAMRARGARVTDLAIIIVAADDNVMPQTVEAINHASAAGVPIVFAINKIDKPAANPDKIKEELSAMNYLVEDWGGKYQSQEISAKKGLGVDELMEKVLLEAEMLDLKANPDRNAVGSIIESSLDKGRGYVATVLVQNGTLRVGDVVLAGTHHGKIRAMFNERNQRVTEAGPATPVLVLGLNGAPTAGDTFNVLDTEQEAREIASKREQLQRELANRTQKRLGLSELARRKALGDFHQLNLIVKGDVDGSIEALSDSLIKLSTPEVQVNVLHKGVGAISESDVTLAAASDAIIIGFQVRPSAAARREAEKEGVEVRLYSVIYKAIEEVKDAMEGMLSPEIREEITGMAEVLQTYHISKVGTIAGAIVRDGKVKRASKVRVIRDGIVVYTGELGSLKRFKDDAKEVVSGFECGLSVANYNNIETGDMIEAYEEIAVKKSL